MKRVGSLLECVFDQCSDTLFPPERWTPTAVAQGLRRERWSVQCANTDNSGRGDTGRV
jgi:hypothetical protein